jgi:hypothetical protein
MALIKCPECQTEVSDKADKCPKCGTPIKFNDPLEKIASILGLIFGIPYFFIGIGLFIAIINSDKNSPLNIILEFIFCLGLTSILVIKYLPKKNIRGSLSVGSSFLIFTVLFLGIEINRTSNMEQIPKAFYIPVIIPLIILLILGALFFKIESNRVKNSIVN